MHVTHSLCPKTSGTKSPGKRAPEEEASLRGHCQAHPYHESPGREENTPATIEGVTVCKQQIKGPVKKVQGMGMPQVGTDRVKRRRGRVGSPSHQKWVTWMDPEGWL